MGAKSSVIEELCSITLIPAQDNVNLAGLYVGKKLLMFDFKEMREETKEINAEALLLWFGALFLMLL